MIVVENLDISPSVFRFIKTGIIIPEALYRVFGGLIL